MTKRKTVSVTSCMLAGVQFSCVGAILVSGPWIAGDAALFAMELLGGLLGVWALTTMKLKNVHVLPEVKAGSCLVTGGPYHWIRHPMYTALLTVTLALVCESFSAVRGFSWLLLFATLAVKLSREERCLREAFDEYEAYRLRTWRLVPWIV